MNPTTDPTKSAETPETQAPVVPEAPLRAERLAADLIETDAGWRVVLAMPGVTEADLDVHVERGSLQVSAVRRADVPEGATVLRAGPGAARGEREFLLPDGVGADQVSASLDGGLLTVEIARPAAERVRVPIREA